MKTSIFLILCILMMVSPLNAETITTSKAYRNGPELTLVLENKEKIIRRDSPEDEFAGHMGKDGVNVAYRFEKYFEKENFFLIEINYWEGHAYELISEKTGDSYLLDDYPDFSPNGKKLITTSFGGDAGYSPDALKIYKIIDGKPILEYSIDDTAYGFGNIKWKGSNKFDIRFWKIDYSIKSGVLFSDNTYQFVNGNWQLVKQGDFKPFEE